MCVTEVKSCIRYLDVFSSEQALRNKEISHLLPHEYSALALQHVCLKKKPTGYNKTKHMYKLISIIMFICCYVSLVMIKIIVKDIIHIVLLLGEFMNLTRLFLVS